MPGPVRVTSIELTFDPSKSAQPVKRSPPRRADVFDGDRFSRERGALRRGRVALSSPAPARYAEGVSRLAVVCAAFLFAFGAADARAAITVNTFTDESVSGDGQCSLREAVTAANFPGGQAAADCPGAAISGTTTINLPAGTYELAPGVGLFFFSPTVTIAVQGASDDPSRTVINGQDDVSHRGHVLQVDGGAHVMLSGLTVVGGWTQDGIAGQDGVGAAGGSGGSAFPGGGIDNGGGLTLDHVQVSGNKTGAGGAGGQGASGFPGGPGGDGGHGGGIVNTGTLTATDSTISANTAGAGGAGGPGGGILDRGGAGGSGGAGAGIENTGSATLTRTTVSGNIAGSGAGSEAFFAGPSGAGGDGGGIANDGTLNTESSEIAQNTAGAGTTAGGGGSGGGIASTATMTLADTTINGNAAGSGGGGAFLTPDGGKGGTGGGIFDSGTAKLTNVTIAANGAGAGGAGSVGSGVSNGGNGGPAGGGAGIEYVNPGSMSLTAVTLTQNAIGRPGAGGQATGSGTNGAIGASAAGGAIEDAGTSLTETSTLVAINSRPMCAGTPTDGGSNLDFPAIDTSCPGINGDPKLATLAANGGFAQTVALQAGSAAIDRVPLGAGCPATDERGVSRPEPAGANCDIGAYEFALPACAPISAATVSGSAVRIQLSCTDPAGAPLTYVIDAGPAHGSLTGLDPATGKVNYDPTPTHVGPDSFTYHAVNGNGTAASQTVSLTVTKGPTGPPPILRPIAPSLTRLAVTPGAFHDRQAHPGRGHRRHRATGATISYVVNEAAVTTFTVLVPRPGALIAGKCVRPPRSPRQRRRVARCTRHVPAGSFRHFDRTGINSFRFSGVIRGVPLAPGGYELRAVPAVGSLHGATVIRAFRILR